MRVIIRQIVCLALMYCVTGPLLLFVEVKAFGTQLFQQALPIVGLSVFFFAFTVGELLLSRRLHQTRKEILTSYYLLMKVIRMILCILICIAYYLLKGNHVTAFCINLFVLYIATMVFSTISHIHMEKKHT